MGEVMASILSGLRPQTSTGCGAEPSGQVSRLVEADGLGLRLRVSAGLAPASPVQAGLRDPRTVHLATVAQQGARGVVAGDSRVACYAPSVTRPRASAPDSPRLLLPLIAAVALVVAGCGSAQGTVAPSAPAVSAAPVEPASADPGSSAPTTPDPGSPTPSDAPSTPPEPIPSSESGPASDCTGTDENRTFYSAVAVAVDWTVYCPVLPSGWFVEAGQYRLAAGGRLAIAYRGPGGTRFSLDEGVWCTDGSGCVPAGTELGATAFGDRTGTLIATPEGDYAIIVDAGSTVSWLLTGDGLDEATIRTFGAALIALGD